jgi:hypothetical protein
MPQPTEVRALLALVRIISAAEVEAEEHRLDREVSAAVYNFTRARAGGGHTFAVPPSVRRAA